MHNSVEWRHKSASADGENEETIRPAYKSVLMSANFFQLY